MEVCGAGSAAVLASALTLPERTVAEAAESDSCFSQDEAKWRQWLTSGACRPAGITDAAPKDGSSVPDWHSVAGGAVPGSRDIQGGAVVQLRAKDPRLARPSALTPHLTIPTAGVSSFPPTLHLLAPQQSSPSRSV